LRFELILIKPGPEPRPKLIEDQHHPRQRERRSLRRRRDATKAKGDSMYKHILVPTDGSKLSVKAAKQAVKLAKALGAKITAFHAVPDFSSTYYAEGYILRVPPAEAQAEFAQKEARRCLSVIEVEAEVEKVDCDILYTVSDSPYEAIIDAAKKKKCDLIVMASHGRRGLSALVIGSETHKVLVYSKVPVLVCR
jgi:nucleotide-binding universal stress UspA family protein